MVAGSVPALDTIDDFLAAVYRLPIMPRETQLDTHEIDKLLDDDDFIDDFDFSEDLDEQFAGAEDDLEEAAVADDAAPAADADSGVEDELNAGAGSRKVGELVDELDLDFGDLEDFKLGGARTATRGSRILKLVVALLVLLWLVQLAGVIYLFRRPVIIRDRIQPLAAEISVKPAVSTPEPAAPASVKAASFDEPDIYVFTNYVKLYSLDGLKVFSVEVEVVQYQKTRRLTDAEKVLLKESLRQALADAVADHMREEVVDLSAQLTALIVPQIEKFFIARGIDPKDVKIRAHNPYIE